MNKEKILGLFVTYGWIILAIAIIGAAAFATITAPEKQSTSRETHDKVIQYLETDEDNKQIAGIIAGEIGTDEWSVKQAQWNDFHNYETQYYCFEQNDTTYCQLKEAQ